jgi:hypothetical protein
MRVPPRAALVAIATVVAAALALSAPSTRAASAGNPGDIAGLVAAMLGDTPLEEDLAMLTDEVGGRATGSAANLRSVEWGLARFAAASVQARKEPFAMPARWLERSASASVGGAISYAAPVVAMPFSAPTPPGGLTAPLVDAGRGSDDDFVRLAGAAKGAFALVETDALVDLDGLFREYRVAVSIERRAFGAEAAGVVYMASRPHGLLYRHNASLGPDNRVPLLIMDREAAGRALRLLRAGKRLTLTARIDVDSAGAYESFNVVGEIRGRDRPDEIVVIGAHLDSWDLGTGALDNGCNVAMVIDIARQIVRLGLRPRRTIRFALFNGEEQGLIGSWGYTKAHDAELDRHVMASSYDIGSGRITGFFTNGRADLRPPLERALEPVAGLGPYQHVNAPIVGTDNYDFMMQGVPNLVAAQESANYGPNYHARSDTFDKVDLRQLRLNGAIAAAVTWGFAEMELTLPRHTRTQIEELIRTTDLGEQMKSMGVWKGWQEGVRGRLK